MNDAKARETGAGFTEHERPTRPFARLRTATSRWRAVASAAIQRGFGRESDGDFHLGNDQAEDGAREAPGPEASDEELSIDVHVEEQAPVMPSVVLCESIRPAVVRVERPTRDFGPRGTIRMVPRRDLGPTGTVLIRRRPAPRWMEAPRLSTRVWARIATLAAACAVVTVIAYRGSAQPPLPTTVPSPATPAQLPVVTATPVPPLEPSPTVEPSATSTAATAAAAAAPPVRAVPRRSAASKAPRVKSTVF